MATKKLGGQKLRQAQNMATQLTAFQAKY